jgi:hypothetical protein
MASKQNTGYNRGLSGPRRPQRPSRFYRELKKVKKDAEQRAAVTAGEIKQLRDDVSKLRDDLKTQQTELKLYKAFLKIQDTFLDGLIGHVTRHELALLQLKGVQVQMPNDLQDPPKTPPPPPPATPPTPDASDANTSEPVIVHHDEKEPEQKSITPISSPKTPVQPAEDCWFCVDEPCNCDKSASKKTSEPKEKSPGRHLRFCKQLRQLYTDKF